MQVLCLWIVACTLTIACPRVLRMQFVDPCLSYELRGIRPGIDSEPAVGLSWPVAERVFLEMMARVSADLRRGDAAGVEPALPLSEEERRWLSNLWAKDDELFVAGRLGERAEFWEKVVLPATGFAPAKCATILRWLREGPSFEEFMVPFAGEFGGVQYESDAPLSYVGVNHPSCFEYSDFMDQTVADHLKSGALVRWEEDTPPVIVNAIGVALNATSLKLRGILDGRYGNNWQSPASVKYDSLSSWKDGIGVGDNMLALDHKSGYLNVRVSESSRKYFAVEWRGVLYVWTVMPFGWSPACYVYQTLSSCGAAYLRSKGFNLMVFIDDIGESIPKSLSERGVYESRFLFFGLPYLQGYYVSRTKSKPVPSPRIELLGFGLDSEAQMFNVPAAKLSKIFALLDETLSVRRVSVSVMRSLVGKLQALSLAAPAVSLFLRTSYDALALYDKRGSRNETILLSDEIKLDLRELYALRDWDCLSLWRVASHVRMETDASSKRWAAVLYLEDEVTIVGGDFTDGELLLHINVKELLAVAIGVEYFENVLPIAARVDVYVDNTVTQYSGLRGSSPDKEMRWLSRRLLRWQLRRGVLARMLRIPTLQNVLADRKTRELAPMPDAVATVTPDGRRATVERITLKEARRRVAVEL